MNDRHIIENTCDLYQRSNLLISQFRPCNSETLDRLHMTYCMHMYGCELWNLNEKDITQFKVAWRKIKRRIWKISPRTHNNIFPPLITITLLLINEWLHLFTILYSLAMELVQIYYE